MKYALALIHFPLIPAVLGHGYLAFVEIDGQSYSGPRPLDAPQVDTDHVIRQVNTQEPVRNATFQNMSCGPGAAIITASKSAIGKLFL